MQPAADPSEQPTAEQHIPAPRTAEDPPAETAPAATAAPETAAPDGLTDRDREILAFEARWWKHAGAKEQAIRDTFGLSSTRYYQLLNALLDKPGAATCSGSSEARTRSRAVATFAAVTVDASSESRIAASADSRISAAQSAAENPSS